jgi:hypothetical protein
MDIIPFQPPYDPERVLFETPKEPDAISSRLKRPTQPGFREGLLNTDSDLMANMYIVLNCRRKLLEHAYGYYGMELKLAFSSL